MAGDVRLRRWGVEGVGGSAKHSGKNSTRISRCLNWTAKHWKTCPW